jgi:hypothetical protein
MEGDRMKAIAIVPGYPETAGLVDLPEPPTSDGSLLVRNAQSESAAPTRKSPRWYRLAVGTQEGPGGYQDRH